MKATILGEFCTSRVDWSAPSLKSLRWESFRWTGLGQKT
jgi:hypothetical protein